MKKIFLCSFLSMVIFYAVEGQENARKAIESQIDSIKNYIKDKHTEAFALISVYQGDDESRKWKDVYNPENPDELDAARDFRRKLVKVWNECGEDQFEKMETRQESEGLWYVYTYACNGKRLSLAFLKIKGKFCLGGIDVEEIKS